MLVGSSKAPAPGPKPGGTNDATKPITCTVIIGESPHPAGYGAACPGGGAVHAGGSASLTQTTTTRGPSAVCTSAGVDGQCWVVSGAHPPLDVGVHQLSMAVPNSALRSRPEIAAVTARVSGAVSGVGARAGRRRDHRGLFDGGHLGRCLHRPEAGIQRGDDAEQKERQYHSELDERLTAAGAWRASWTHHSSNPLPSPGYRSRATGAYEGSTTKVRLIGTSGFTFTGLAGWSVLGLISVLQLPAAKTSRTYGPPIGTLLKLKSPAESAVV